MFNNSNHQGRFHLLSILMVPALLVSFFLPESIIPGIVMSIICAILLFFIFRKK